MEKGTPRTHCKGRYSVKILIVDDDKNRTKELCDYIVKNCNIDSKNIVVKHTTNSAKRILKSTFFDYLILDVILPSKDETPSSENGIRLLKQLFENKHLKKPSNIVGITADVDGIQEYNSIFTKYLNLVIDASPKMDSWKSNISESINYHQHSVGSRVLEDTTLSVISAHGIRTFGLWQGRLEKLISDESGSIDFQSFKFGYFDIISFAVPALRKNLVRRLHTDLTEIVTKQPNKKFLFFSHSFGTYLIVHALNSILEEGYNVDIRLIVLSGSVINQKTDLSKILNSTKATIVNECGIEDNILLLSEAFIPGAGMAGRVGLTGFENSRVINRFYKGGHSLYFDNGDDFMSKQWVPLLYSSPSKNDERSKPGFFKRKLETVASFYGTYLSQLPLVIFLVLIFTSLMIE